MKIYSKNDVEESPFLLNNKDIINSWTSKSNEIQESLNISMPSVLYFGFNSLNSFKKTLSKTFRTLAWRHNVLSNAVIKTFLLITAKLIIIEVWLLENLPAACLECMSQYKCCLCLSHVLEIHFINYFFKF